jgi:hypothetical protein
MAIATSLTGCAASRLANNRGVPADFAVGLTVPAAGATSKPGAPKPALALARPAWYLVEADGDLRVGLGERTTRSVQPPRLRHLSAAEREAIWHTVDGRFKGAGEPGNAEMPRATDGAETAVVYIARNGTRRAHRVDLTRDDEDAHAVGELASVLNHAAGLDRPGR